MDLPSSDPFPDGTAKAVADGPDGLAHLLWTNTNGTALLWNIHADSTYTFHQYGPFPGWSAVSLSVGGDGQAHLLWDKTDGTASLWSVDTSSGAYTHGEAGPFSGWTAEAVASGTSVTDLLWSNTNGAAAGVRFRANGADFSLFGPFAGYSAVALSVGPDDGAHLLWDKTDGTAALWSADFSTGAYTPALYGPFSGWAAQAIATGPDGATHLLWDNADGQISLWNVTGSGQTRMQYGPFAGWTAVALSAGP